MIELIDQLCDTAGRLRSGRMLLAADLDPGDQPMVVGLILSFDGVSVRISASDDDELTLAEGNQDFSGGHGAEIADSPTWKGALGRPILWVWRLVNQQGYQDCLQFEFAEHGGADSCTLQLVAAAGQLHVRRVHQMEPMV